jgi:hypothetical protein
MTATIVKVGYRFCCRSSAPLQVATGFSVATLLTRFQGQCPLGSIAGGKG